MEIKPNKTDKHSNLKVGDFVFDVEPNRGDAYLGVVKLKIKLSLGVKFIHNYRDLYYKTEGQEYSEFSPNCNWWVVSKQEALKFIAKQNPNGFTVNKNTLEPITEGWAIAVSETQNSFGEEGLKQVIKHAEQKSYIEAIGGWLNSKDGQYYFDAVMVVQDYETAAELGYRNKQKAVFNLSEGKEYELK